MSGVRIVALRRTIGNNNKTTKGRSGGSDLSGHILGEIGGVRTEVQLRPFEGFAQGEIEPNIGVRMASEGARTPQRAKPPAWTERTKCAAQLDKLGRNEWADRWDMPSDLRGKVADEYAAAKCAGCPVIDSCLQSALEEEHGLHHSGRYLIRGGLSPKGRWRLDAVEDKVEVTRSD